MSNLTDNVPIKFVHKRADIYGPAYYDILIEDHYVASYDADQNQLYVESPGARERMGDILLTAIRRQFHATDTKVFYES